MFLRASIKGFLLLLLIFALWAGCTFSAAADSRDILSLPGLAVTDFTGNGLSPSDRELMSDLFGYLCAESSRYLVLERNERDKILRRKGRRAAGSGPLMELISLGIALNVDFILSGQVTAQNDRWILELNLIEVSGGMITRHWLKEYPSVELL